MHYPFQAPTPKFNIGHFEYNDVAIFEILDETYPHRYIYAENFIMDKHKGNSGTTNRGRSGELIRALSHFSCEKSDNIFFVETK
jgi:hypothetical protein